ncbi:hypothetical protein [Polyangium sp. 15x6]|uniref:hypothetical protein n=1 Tax=Polyangium sp. 15x6 TaxID=3042687 RepID=UPI00249A6BFB|nr:hypothetical protein [Polyangium sp. 15x6]MDI3285000.1 hypothetical protein [Polyangium sp. 15x6]
MSKAREIALAEALATYERLAAEPLGPTSPPAFRKAREEGSKRERALLALVPSLLVVVTGAATEDVKATVDGKPLALGTGVATRSVRGGKEDARRPGLGRARASARDRREDRQTIAFRDDEKDA